MKRDGQLSPHEEAEIHTAHQRELRRAFYRRNPELPRPIDVKAVLDHTPGVTTGRSEARMPLGSNPPPPTASDNSSAGSSEEPEYSGGQSTEKHKSEDAES